MTTSARPAGTPPRLSVALVGALVLLTLGALGGVLLAPDDRPDSLAPARPVTTAAVTYEVFEDERQLAFEVVDSPGRDVPLPRGGTVTTLTCEPGGTLTSGDVPLSLDARPVAAVYTEYPLYRDLEPGLKGPDVAALQSALERLGYSVGTSGTLDRATRSAVRSFFKDRGDLSFTGTLFRADILQLPSADVAIDTCALHLGDEVQPGDAYARTQGGLLALRLAVTPDGLAPGERAVSLGSVRALLGEDGTVTDPAFLDAVASSAAYATAAAQTEDGSAPRLTLTTSLTTPLDTAVVPAAALFGVSGSTGCITTDGRPVPVTIVTSSLGATYVTLADGSTPDRVDLRDTGDRTSSGATCA